MTGGSAPMGFPQGYARGLALNRTFEGLALRPAKASGRSAISRW